MFRPIKTLTLLPWPIGTGTAEPIIADQNSNRGLDVHNGGSVTVLDHELA